tara:strand:+ start:244 stop:507 length:264 start_codon:yes stop_codon:yes gene_type:complete
MMNKRNPCTYAIEVFDESGHLVKQIRRGYIQERNNKERMYLIDTGTNSDVVVDERWISYDEVKLTKDRWTNKSKKVISRKSFWTRAK